MGRASPAEQEGGPFSDSCLAAVLRTRTSSFDVIVRVSDQRAPWLCLKALPPRSVGFAAWLGAHTGADPQLCSRAAGRGGEVAADCCATGAGAGRSRVPPPAEEEVGSLHK